MTSKTAVEILTPAPVLNIAEFHIAFGGKDGCEIPRNSLGHPRYMELVALPGQKFIVIGILPRHHHSILKVTSATYPSFALYLDSRFTRPSSFDDTEITLPTREALASNMQALLGASYVWGGNWSAGIPQMLHFYPPQGPIDEETKRLWMLQGVDCSGLLYEASGGVTPRNTSQLLHFGTPLPIEGKNAAEIAEQLLPLDMVIWPGHTWFVFSKDRSIESKSPFGVIQRPLVERLEETCKNRRGVNEWSDQLDPERYFCIRRFCDLAAIS